MPLGTHVKPQAQQELCKGDLHGCRREVGNAASGFAPFPAWHQYPGEYVLSLPGPGLLWERSHTPNPHRLLKSLFHQPLANCSCSQDAHLHSRTQWLGKGPQKTQVETKAGQTHQLFEEGSFLVLLRIALILVQAILQLQREGVIVGSHYL